MATYQSIRYNVDYGGKAGALMALLLFTSDGSDATATFSSKIDSTYDSYLFIYNNIHPETDGTALEVNFSTDGGSNYNVTKTTTSFRAYHFENDAGTNIHYDTDTDLAQSTAFVKIAHYIKNDNDTCASGHIHIFNPSSTVFVKHFISRSCFVHGGDYSMDEFVAGYGNTTSAVDAIQFKMSADEIQGGTIGMFGVI